MDKYLQVYHQSKNYRSLAPIVLCEWYNSWMNTDTELLTIFRLSEGQKAALKKLGLATVGDLLYYFPTRYGDADSLAHVAELKKGDQPIIYAQATKVRARKAFTNRKLNMTEAVLVEPNGNWLFLHRLGLQEG